MVSAPPKPLIVSLPGVAFHEVGTSVTRQGVITSTTFYRVGGSTRRI